MKRVVIIQARMGSTRLPGKVLMDLEGRPMLARQLDRLKRCQFVDAICLATTTGAADDVLVDLAAAEGVAAFRGDESDVLGRYVGAAASMAADVVVRITADCPLIAPEVVDQVIDCAVVPDAACDYASNTATRRFPRGLDTEVMFMDTLRRLDRLARSRPAREHVTWFIHSERPDLFVRRDVLAVTDDSDLRWTVDTAEDLAMVRALFAAAQLGQRALTAIELVAFVRRHPEISRLNAGIEQRRS
jgi:spore coat polysaccharide biosynthesis protein SpsF